MEYLTGCIAAEGLCLSDFMVLEVLLHKGALPISDIGHKVLLANASMTAAVDRLEKRGLVFRQNAANDRRSRIVELTPPGREFISELYARHARDIEAVMAVLSEKQKRELRAALKTLGLSARAAKEQRTKNQRRTTGQV